MPAIAKRVNVIGLLGKEETVNGTAVSLDPDEDGIRLWPENRDGIPLAPAYLWDGFQSEAPGGLGVIDRNLPQGKHSTFAIRTYFQGAGEAYAADKVSSLHKLLKMAGLDATLDATATSEKWTYAPTLEGDPFTTLTLAAYTRGELYPLSFGIANWRYEWDDRGIMRHIFETNGICGETTDVTLPSITYPLLSVRAPTVAGMSLRIGPSGAGGHTLLGIKGGSWDMGRVLEERAGADAADIHMGWGPRNRTPSWTINVEQSAFVDTPFYGTNGFNPWKMWETMQKFRCALQHPGAKYNRWNHIAEQAQLKQPPEMTSVAGIACVQMVIEPILSTPVANDDFAFVTD